MKIIPPQFVLTPCPQKNNLLKKIVSVLLSASVERVGVSHMRHFFLGSWFFLFLSILVFYLSQKIGWALTPLAPFSNHRPTRGFCYPFPCVTQYQRLSRTRNFQNFTHKWLELMALFLITCYCRSLNNLFSLLKFILRLQYHGLLSHFKISHFSDNYGYIVKMKLITYI